MRISPLIFLITLVPVLAAPARAAEPPLVGEGVIDATRSAVFAPVVINGQQVTAHLDLGTTGNILTAAMAAQLDLTGVPFARSVTLGSSTQARVRFAIGRAPRTGVLLGSDIQSYFDLVFDGPARTVRFYAHQPPAADGAPSWFPAGVSAADCMPIGFDPSGARRIFFPVQLDGHPVHAMFDSGAGATNINVYGARDVGLTLASGRVRPVHFGFSRLGQYLGRWAARPVVLTAGGRRLATDRVVIFRHLPRERLGPGIQDGELSIGLRAVRDRVLYISYSANEVCLGPPSKDAIDPPPSDAGSGPRLDAGELGRLGRFWTRFLQEPAYIRRGGRAANQEPVTLSIDGEPVRLRAVDMTAMAAKFAPVAAALSSCGLTAARWEADRRALFSAYLALEAGASAPPGSVLAANVAFLESHRQLLEALRATGMWFPPVPRAPEDTADGDDNLSP